MGKIIKRCLLLIIVAVMFQACATTGSAGNSAMRQVYSQPFEKMVEVTEQAVRGSGLNIDDFFKSDDGTAITLIVNTNVFVNNESVQKDQGMVIVRMLENDKTQVEVENPEYHYTVPNYQREKYNRRIFSQIRSILGGSKASLIHGDG